ncbi:MAG: hypothetical protein IJU96_07535 [Clostridia bacterium]|nr:hypothetical protein [Clostridia bacterium]
MSLTAKKIYSVILLTAMLCGLFSTVFLAQAAQAPTFTVNNTMAAAPGETVDVAITVNSSAGFCAGEFTVTYDKDVLEPVSVTKGSAAGTYFVGNATYTANKMFFATIDTDLINAAGTVATLTFRVKDHVVLYNGTLDLEVGTIVGNEAEGYGYKDVSCVAQDGIFSAARSIDVPELDDPEQINTLPVVQMGSEFVLSSPRTNDLSITEVAKNFSESLVTKFLDPVGNELPAAKKLTTGSVIELYSNDTLKNTITVSVKGDVNGDDTFDGFDAYLAGLLDKGVLTAYEIGAAANDAADVNEDGAVDEADFEQLESNGLNQ